jgi:hypothetical protein
MPGRAYQAATTGWLPTCSCSPEQPPVPCRVLDPFGGSGTTALAADRLGRDCTLVEINPQYAALSERRVTRDAPLLMWGAVSAEGGAEPEAETPDGQTKQERHPNRTVAGFNQRWAARKAAVAGEGAAG